MGFFLFFAIGGRGGKGGGGVESWLCVNAGEQARKKTHIVEKEQEKEKRNPKSI